MALTDAQKAEVRRYLGYPDLSQGSPSYLEGAMIAISADAEAQIIVILDDLSTIETQLRSSWTLQKVKKAEDVELWGFDQIIALRAEGSRLVNMLAAILGVPVECSPFSSGSRYGQAGRG